MSIMVKANIKVHVDIFECNSEAKGYVLLATFTC